MEIFIADTGCTTSSIPLSVAKTHNLKVSQVDKDEPDMKTYNGLGLKIVGQTKLYLKIKTRRGFTSKKLLHALVVDHSYDREILISWDNCLAYGIIPESFPYLDMDEDSDNQEENVNSIKTDVDSEDDETSKNRRTQEDKNPELFQKLLNEAISKIESREKEEENRKIAERLRKKYLKKYSDVFKKKLEREDTMKCKK